MVNGPMLLLAAALAGAAPLPGPGFLPELPSAPDSLVFADGGRVASAADWPRRRAELRRLFEHYVYGHAPPLPEAVEVSTVRVDRGYLGGAATRRVERLRFGPGLKGSLELVLVLPNQAVGPSPCLLGLNLDEAELAPLSVRRGYAFATFKKEDVAPDGPDWRRGIYPLYFRPGQTRPGPNDWGALAAWSWALRLVARQLVRDPLIADTGVAVVGHSRHGKAALLAGALSDDIALVIAHQSGTGGASPSRVLEAGRIETVADLADHYPFWFTPVFRAFRDHTTRLPVAQSSLLALVAPRPLLLGTGPDERWTNPAGQFRAAREASRVYRLLGSDGLRTGYRPVRPGRLVSGHIGWYVRSQRGHFLTGDDWEAFLTYADGYLRHGPRDAQSVATR